jgi:outer membrane lipoprotein-sorting protein
MLTSALLIVAAFQKVSPEEVIRRSVAAHTAVKSLHVQVSLKSGGRKADANIYFKRPGQLRVSGNSLFGSRYDLVVNGKAVWFTGPDGWEKAKNVDEGLAAITGVSGNTGTYVPALLMHTTWGDPFALGPKITVSQEKIGSTSVYHLASKSPMERDIWVDAKTYFLVRSQMKFQSYVFLLNYTKPQVNVAIPASKFVKS